MMVDESVEQTGLWNTPSGRSASQGMLAALPAVALATPTLAAPGDLAPTFGSGGIVKTAIGTANDSYATALLQQPDGKLVAGGHSGPSGFALARHNPDGSLDTSFGTSGVARTPIGSGGGVGALAVLPNGKLVAAGGSGDWVQYRVRPRALQPRREPRYHLRERGQGHRSHCGRWH